MEEADGPPASRTSDLNEKVMDATSDNIQINDIELQEVLNDEMEKDDQIE